MEIFEGEAYEAYSEVGRDVPPSRLVGFRNAKSYQQQDCLTVIAIPVLSFVLNFISCRIKAGICTAEQC